MRIHKSSKHNIANISCPEHWVTRGARTNGSLRGRPLEGDTTEETPDKDRNTHLNYERTVRR